MILVAGATGMLGSAICRKLRSSGKPVRALVRSSSDASRVADLQSVGAELVVGDLKDPASVRRACAGVDTVISTVTMITTGREGDSFQAVDEDGQLGLVQAARDAGVRHFVYVSFRWEGTPDSPLVRAKQAVEGALRGSGMTYTILQPSCFMEVWLGPHLGFDYHNCTARMLGSGDQRISYVSVDDVAEFAVRSLERPEARNATIRFGGPAVSPREVIRTFEEVTGHPFQVEQIPEAGLEAQWRGATDPMQRTFASLMLLNARGDEVPADPLTDAFGVQLSTVRDYAERVAKPVPA